MIVVTVRGLPAPQGSKRHVGNGRMVESSKAVGPWREAVRAETQRVMDTAEPLQGPLWVRLRFTLPRPKGHTGKRGLLPSAPVWPAVKPDLDKLARAALDGLVAGGAMADDARVVQLDVRKQYVVHDFPGMVAEVAPMPWPLELP